MRGVAALVAVLAIVAAACGGGSGGGGHGSNGSKHTSIVVLGDSVAAGEGIAYGYTYASTERPPRWTGGLPDPVWLAPYPLCHQTAQAYGDVVAQRMHARLASFACTGSSYEAGIVGPATNGNRDGRSVLRPAQFGDWQTRTGLNAAYDRAAPDVVLVTLGADDLGFVPVVESCVVAALLRNGTCTATNPGPTVQSRVLDALPSLATHYRDLVAAIRDRAHAHHRSVPRIVFTTYYDPLPEPTADVSLLACPDAAGLSRAEIAYLRSLVDRLNATIRDSLRGEEHVMIADASHALDGHEWCTPEPWAYGASVLSRNPASQAPFHPTPAGQQAIARVVLARLRG